MERGFLEGCLERGMSLEAIGELVGKHPSTVSYWLKKHGLEANGRSQHAPKGAIDPERLRALVEGGASITRIARELSAGKSTLRYG
jgi:transposase-like protein